MVLVLPYVGTKSSFFERDIKYITEKSYYSAKSRVIIKSSPMFTPKGKNPISVEDNSCVVYTFECCSKNRYIEQTFRHLRTRIKEHIPKCDENYIRCGFETTNTAIINAMKISSIAEHLINSSNCAKYYDKTTFRILENVAVYLT